MDINIHLLDPRDDVPCDEEEEDDILIGNNENETEEKKKQSIRSFNNDIKEAMIKFGCIVYFIVGLSTSIGTVSREVDLNQTNGEGLLKLLTSFMITCYITNFLLVIYNRYINSKRRSSTPRNKLDLLVYGLAIPLMAVSIIYVLVQVIQQSMFSDQTDNATMTWLWFYIVFVISLIILMIDENRIGLDENQPDHKLVNKASILITLVGILSSLILNLTRRELFIFKGYSAKYYNVTYSNNIMSESSNDTMYQLQEKIKNYLFPIHAAFLVICLSFFLGSLMKSYENNRGGVVNFNLLNRKVKSWTSFFSDVLVGVLIIILCVASIPLVEDSEKRWLHVVLFHILQCVIYSVGIVLSIIQIKEIRMWPQPNNDTGTIMHKILILVGGFGQIIFIINSVSVTIQTIKKSSGKGAGDKEYAILSGGLMSLTSVFLLIQVTFQSIVVHLTLLASPVPPKPGSAAKMYCPSMGLFGLNVGCLVLLLCISPLTYIQDFKSISINFFHKGLHMIAISFAMAHRLHGCLFFGLLVNKISELQEPDQ